MDWGIMMVAVALGAMLVLALAETSAQKRHSSSTEGINPSFVGRGKPWIRRVVSVSGLPASVTEERLTELFVSHGTVDITWLVRSRITGQSEGHGFVMMGTEEEAQEALATLHGTMLEGTLILCTIFLHLPPGTKQSTEASLAI